MDSMRSMVRGNGMADNYVLLAGENEHFFELDLTSGYVYKKNEVCIVKINAKIKVSFV